MPTRRPPAPPPNLRDMKLENVMLCAEDPHAVKLVDFGLAVQVPQNADGSLQATLFYDRVGSKSYRAPEILANAGYLGPPVDVWALGITIFSLVSGFFPLDEARASDWRFARLAQDQQRGVGPCDSIYAMYKRACPFTPELKELLNAMLTIDPAQRVTMAQISAHRFFVTKEVRRRPTPRRHHATAGRVRPPPPGAIRVAKSSSTPACDALRANVHPRHHSNHA